MNSRFLDLEKIGQSVWLDNISRDILNNKELERLLDNWFKGL